VNIYLNVISYRFHYWKYKIPSIYTEILFLTTEFKYLTKIHLHGTCIVFALQSLIYVHVTDYVQAQLMQDG